MTRYSAASGADFGTLEYFNRQAGQWQGLMQQMAMQFAGGDPSAAEVGQAWRQLLASQGGVAAFGLFQDGLPGVMQETAFREARRWLETPAFGLSREHQERWQALAVAQQDYQQQLSAYTALLGEVSQRACDLFEQALGEREAPGRQLQSLRGLFDLWIDAAEQAYADAALSPRFRSVYGALVNAQMRMQSGIQREVEQFCARFGIPTRTEVDAAHRRINQLERALRKFDAAREERRQEASAKSSPGAARAPARPEAAKTAKVAKAKTARNAKTAKGTKTIRAARVGSKRS